jgi:hypothetical protein
MALHDDTAIFWHRACHYAPLKTKALHSMWKTVDFHTKMNMLQVQKQNTRRGILENDIDLDDAAVSFNITTVPSDPNHVLVDKKENDFRRGQHYSEIVEKNIFQFGTALPLQLHLAKSKPNMIDTILDVYMNQFDVRFDDTLTTAAPSSYLHDHNPLAAETFFWSRESPYIKLHMKEIRQLWKTIGWKQNRKAMKIKKKKQLQDVFAEYIELVDYELLQLPRRIVPMEVDHYASTSMWSLSKIWRGINMVQVDSHRRFKDNCLVTSLRCLGVPVAYTLDGPFYAIHQGNAMLLPFGKKIRQVSSIQNGALG